ncbi:hypothetical protein GCM10022225_65650 [Plantactinospora mayteni]|uniref:ESX-1 secretion-associated protein n=1 Tax=Plantactinospora mayteni TaxID=566021 RepID=A0ABQ4EPR1_9ACTN|nr:hypothetical protein [Plantactinospora mayteni]GIG96654.1 hypothetical protein Pma05_32270 [Plantactinospora mayteni]
MSDPTTTKVITENVREEGKKWRDLSDDMDAVKTNPVGNQGLMLGATAFFIGQTELVATAMHSQAYNGYYEHVQKLVAGAVTEWDQLGGAMDRMADEFDRTDQTAKANLEKIYTQP